MVGPYLCKKQPTTAIMLCIQWGKQRRWLSHLCRYIGKRAKLYRECASSGHNRGGVVPPLPIYLEKGQVVQIVGCCLISVDVAHVRKRLHRMMDIDTNRGEPYGMQYRYARCVVFGPSPSCSRLARFRRRRHQQ